MSLLTSYSNANKRETQGLLTVYQTVYDTTSQSNPFYQYTRIRTKTYSYVGMTKAAAKACAAAKIQQYTRSIRAWEWYNGSWRQISTSSGLYTDLVAGISINRTGGEMWQVDIQVNETAIIYMRNPPTDIEDAFDGYLGTWEYDED